MRALGKLFLVASVGMSGLVMSSGTSAEPTVGEVNDGVSFGETDQLIVKAARGRSVSVAALSEAAGAPVKKVRDLADGAVVVRLSKSQRDNALRATAQAFARVGGVEWVEPDVWMTTVTDDPLFSAQWDLGPAGPAVFGIDVAGAWAALPSNPSSVNVAVVDTGQVDHADLDAITLPGYDFIGDTRIANDGNGRDGDARDPGDWITSQESRSGFFRGCTVSNSSWHGTHVAGTIAAVSGNHKGIAGVNPHARIVPVRVLGKCGGYTSDITDGVLWAAGLTVIGVPNNPNVAKVVNLSLGGSGACSSTWQSAIDAVTAAGTTVVVAAGNANSDAAAYSPASCNGVITVASTGKAGARAYYSNYGSVVEIAAPGGDRLADGGDTVLSTLNTGSTSPVASPGGDTYVRYQGTSMASPHVAGVASLMLSANPALSPAQITQLMQQSATPFPSGSNCTTSLCGAGIVDAAGAVVAAGGANPGTTTTTTTTTTLATTTTTMPPPVPGAFVKTSPADDATGAKTNVVLSWSGSTGATGYWVCLEIDSTPNGTCDAFTEGPFTTTGVRFTGLSAGSTYEWQVRADNSAGSTVASGSAWSFSTR